MSTKITYGPDLVVAELIEPASNWSKLGNRREAIEAYEAQIVRILSFHMFIRGFFAFTREEAYFEPGSREHQVIHINIPPTVSHPTDTWVEIVPNTGAIYFIN